VKDRTVKQVMLRRGRVNEGGKGGEIWLIYFLYIYEYGPLKPVKPF
jgi:hypothetical protein